MCHFIGECQEHEEYGLSLPAMYDAYTFIINHFLTAKYNWVTLSKVIGQLYHELLILF